MPTFEVTVDNAQLEAAQPLLFAAALQQNRAFRKRFGGPEWLGLVLYFSLVVVLWLLATVASVGTILTAVLPQAEPDDLLFCASIAVGGFSLVGLLHWLGAKRFIGARDQLADFLVGPLLRWAAHSAISRTKKAAPFTVVYELRTHEFHVSIESANISKLVQAKDIAVAYGSPGAIVFYQSGAAQRRLSVVYIGSKEHAEAFAGWLETHAIKTLPLDGAA